MKIIKTFTFTIVLRIKIGYNKVVKRTRRSELYEGRISWKEWF